MKRFLLLFIISFLGIMAYSQSHLDDKISKHVYTIKIEDGKKGITQTAFRVKGQKGLVTSLHAFVQLTPSGGEFKNYKIIGIKDWKGEPIIFQNDLPVTKVDVFRGIAYIDIPFFKDSDGISLEIKDTLCLAPKKSKIYSCVSETAQYYGEIASGKALDIRTRSTLRSQLKDSVKREIPYMIPNLDCKVIIIHEHIDGIAAGAPLICINDSKILGVVGCHNAVKDWFWAVPLDMDNLKSYDNLSEEDKNYLKSAFTHCLYNYNPKLMNEPDATTHYKACQQGEKRSRSYKKLNFPGEKKIFKTGFSKPPDISSSNKEDRRLQEIRSYSYPYIKLMPREYRLCEQTDYKYKKGISSMNEVLNTSTNKYKSLNRYAHTKQFIKVVHVYITEKVVSNIFKSKLEELEKEAQQLYLLLDTKLPTKAEQRIWKKANFNFEREANNLLYLVGKRTNEISEDSIANPSVPNSPIIKNDTVKGGITRGSNDDVKKEENKSNPSINSVNDPKKGEDQSIPIINPVDDVKDIEKLGTDIINPAKQNPGFKLDFRTERISENIISIWFKYGDACKSYTRYDKFPVSAYHFMGGDQAIYVIDSIFKRIDEAYCSKGSKYTASITYKGHADGIPFRGSLKYNNDYGEIDTCIVKKNKNDAGRRCRDLLHANNSDTKNQVLAFLRAFGALYTLKNDYNNFLANRASTEVFMETHKDVGGEFRYVEVTLLLIKH